MLLLFFIFFLISQFLFSVSDAHSFEPGHSPCITYIPCISSLWGTRWDNFYILFHGQTILLTNSGFSLCSEIWDSHSALFNRLSKLLFAFSSYEKTFIRLVCHWRDFNHALLFEQNTFRSFVSLQVRQNEIT